MSVFSHQPLFFFLELLWEKNLNCSGKLVLQFTSSKLFFLNKVGDGFPCQQFTHNSTKNILLLQRLWEKKKMVPFFLLLSGSAGYREKILVISDIITVTSAMIINQGTLHLVPELLSNHHLPGTNGVILRHVRRHFQSGTGNTEPRPPSFVLGSQLRTCFKLPQTNKTCLQCPASSTKSLTLRQINILRC